MAELSLQPASAEMLPAIAGSLEDAGLAADGLEELFRLWVICDGGRPVAVGGLERHGPLALLRSLLVWPGWRGLGLGERLVRALEDEARQAGLSELWLITETADGFFRRLGYVPVALADAPEPVRAFRACACRCGQQAEVMIRSLCSGSESGSGRSGVRPVPAASRRIYFQSR